MENSYSKETVSSTVKSCLIRQGRQHDAERVAILQEFRLQRAQCCHAMATAIELGAGEVAASAARHLQHLDRIILALEDSLYEGWVEEHFDRSLEMPWVNWRCLRTSHATWLKLAGADVKDAQAQMRHSRASTTLDVYQQFVPESQQKVVAKLSSLWVN